MTKHVLRLAAISPALIALSGCSYFGIDQYFNQDKVQYESSNTRQNLEEESFPESRERKSSCNRNTANG